MKDVFLMFICLFQCILDFPGWSEEHYGSSNILLYIVDKLGNYATISNKLVIVGGIFWRRWILSNVLGLSVSAKENS